MSRRVPVRALLRSEWTKFRSLRSAWTWLVLYAAVVLTGAWLSLGGATAQQDSAVAVARALVGFAPGQLALLVLGALVVGSEYRTGTVLVSLTAVPGRTRWLVVKTLVVLFWTALATAALAAACVAAVPALTAGPAELPLTDPLVLRPIGLQVVAAMSASLLGVGLGAALRRTVPAAVSGAALVVVLPVATALAGDSRVTALARFWPSLRVGEDDVLTVATRGWLGLPSGGDVLLAGATDWPAGLAVGGAWAVTAWVLGAVLTERRDV